MSKTGGSRVPCLFLRSETWSWTQQTMEKQKGGRPKYRRNFSVLKRKKEETSVDYQTRTSIMARKIWVKMKLPFLFEEVAESMWRAMVWAYNEKENAVVDFLKKVFRWRSTRWWYALHTTMMKEDFENRTGWMMATRWAGEKDWMIKRKEYTSPNDKHKFITYILNKMKLTTEHRRIEKKGRDKRKKTHRDLGLADKTIHTREGGPTVQLCGDSDVPCKWTNGEFAQGTKYKDTIGKSQRILHSLWKKGAATPISDIDNFVKHIYQEHNQEADRCANIDAKGQGKIVLDKNNMESDTWFV